MSRPRMKIPEGLRSAYRAACETGWEVTRTRNGHLRWTSPGGYRVITPGTPHGGRHSMRNTLADLRRAGLQC
jgi:hypothetical protein